MGARKGGPEGGGSCMLWHRTAPSLFLPAWSAILIRRALVLQPRRNAHRRALGRPPRSVRSAPGNRPRARGCPTGLAGSPWAGASHRHHPRLGLLPLSLFSLTSCNFVAPPVSLWVLVVELFCYSLFFSRP